MWTSKNPTSVLLTESTLLLPVLAPNSTSTTTALCSSPTKINANLNSTGQYEFIWNNSYATDDPWYVSVLIRDRGPNYTISRNDVIASPYISVPGDVPNDTGICIYQFNNINATLEAGRENSCNGVISATCVSFLTDTLGETNGPNCPDWSDKSDAFEEACPMLMGSTSRSTEYIDPTNDTCAYTDIPEVQIPGGYNTFVMPGGITAFDSLNVRADAEQAYDLLTRQAIPMVLLGHFVDPQSHEVQNSIEFVCMTANKTVNGSRVSKDEQPWESAGMGVSARRVGWVVAGAVVALAL